MVHDHNLLTISSGQTALESEIPRNNCKQSEAVHRPLLAENPSTFFVFFICGFSHNDHNDNFYLQNSKAYLHLVCGCGFWQSFHIQGVPKKGGLVFWADCEVLNSLKSKSRRLETPIKI